MTAGIPDPPPELPRHQGVLIESLWWGFRSGIRGLFLAFFPVGYGAPWLTPFVGAAAVGLLAGAPPGGSLRWGLLGALDGALGGLATWGMAVWLAGAVADPLIRGMVAGAAGFAATGLMVGLIVESVRLMCMRRWLRDQDGG